MDTVTGMEEYYGESPPSAVTNGAAPAIPLSPEAFGNALANELETLCPGLSGNQKRYLARLAGMGQHR